MAVLFPHNSLRLLSETATVSRQTPRAVAQDGPKHRLRLTSLLTSVLIPKYVGKLPEVTFAVHVQGEPYVGPVMLLEYLYGSRSLILHEFTVQIRAEDPELLEPVMPISM